MNKERRERRITLERTMKKAISLVLAFVLCFSLLTVTASAEERKTKIAAFLPLTGNSKQYGDQISSGISYALADFNEAHGTNYTIEFYDDKADATEAVNVANKIISDPDVLLAFGSFSSTCCLAVANVFVDAEMVQVTPTASHADFFDIANTAISFACKSSVEVTALAEQLRDKFNLPKTAVIYQNTDHGVMTNEVFTEAYTSMGGEVVCSETFVPDSTKDFTPLLSKVKESGAEAIYLSTGYSDGAMIAIQAEKLGIEAGIFGMGSLFVQEFVDLVKDLKAPVYSINLGRSLFADPENDPDYADVELNEDIVEFSRRYKADNGVYPNGFAGYSYDIMSCLLGVIDATDDQSAENLATAIRSVKGYKGLIGEISFTDDGNSIIRESFLMKVVNGTLRYAE